MTTSPGTAVQSRRPASEYVAAAHRISPLIQAASDEIEQRRSLPPEIVEAMRSEGFFHMLSPAECGGEGLDGVTQARVVEVLAEADGSAGWCSMIANQNAAFTAFMNPADAREAFANREIMCGTARPIGRAESVDGGYRVSGRWPFASGSSHAGWFAGESVIYDGDSARTDEHGNAVSVFCMLRPEDVTIIDTWHTSGLRGTASNDFACQDAFVPSRLAISLGEPKVATPLVFALPVMAMNHGTHGLGVARAALKCACEIAGAKMAYGNQTTIAGERRTQLLFAEATVMVESAALYLYSTAQAAWDAAQDGPTDTLTRSRVRLATGNAVRSARQAVDLLHEALGTAAIFQKNPIERQWRDIHTAAQHVMIGTLVYEAAGRAELGMEPDFPFF